MVMEKTAERQSIGERIRGEDRGMRKKGLRERNGGGGEGEDRKI